MADPVILRVNELVRRYSDVTAVRHVSFEVSPGEVVGLIGPNGAGKTTIVNCILGLLAPTYGSVHICGIDVHKRRSEALAYTNFAATYASLQGNLTVIQNLRFFAGIYALHESEARISNALANFELSHLKDRKCGLLSSGQQTRAALAKATLTNPHLLLLDEPTASLDPVSAKSIRAQVRDLALRTRSGILWTSHNMSEVEEVCDRMLFLSSGTIILDGEPRHILSQHSVSTLEDLFLKLAD